MAIGASGSKSKSKESGTQNQVQTNTLSDRAAGMLNQGISEVQGMSYGRFDPASIGQYQSPYTENVIDASLGQADYRDAIARNQQQSEFAKAGAFGDDRRGIYEAELAGAQSRDRASLIAGLNDKAFTDARGVAQGENQNANQYALALQQLLNQLRGGFANEGTQTMDGKTTGKSSGTNLGFRASWSPAKGFN
jgi:hypothetical protein